ncbi:MAG TPA: U32 family peptidase, partial [Verrucomicrobiae bacterium]|nr:U32 family peptidase [Verrucomicrobiae bacterium]
VDAAIVQDVGICRLIRQLSPDFPIHASTQMTITSAAGVEFARALGCNLVVLARECSIREIEKIQSQLFNDECRITNGPVAASDSPSIIRHSSFPLEVFVHGALCVAYSGQCLTSEALGGRSANRGECAQACRMPYELISDGKPVPLGDRKYLLSPQDLAGLEVLPDLIRAGLASLKIEGRLKTPEYVANITRVYRKALDQLLRSGVRQNAANCDELRLSPESRYDMEMAFSRGLYTGWLGGTNNQTLVHARFGKKRGVYLGEVTRILRNAVAVKLEGPLKPGDGIVFDAGHPEEKEEGGRVYEVQNEKSEAGGSKRAVLKFGRGDIDFSRLDVGNKIWKTSDPELDRRLRRSFEGDNPIFQQPVWMEIHGVEGKPLTLFVRDEVGHVVRADSKMSLTKAEKQPLTSKRLGRQLGRLGGAPFRLSELRNHLSGDVLLPVSELNRLRREVVAQLERLRSQPNRWTFNVGQASRLSPSLIEKIGDRREACPTLIALVRNLAQLEAALNCGVQTVYCDFENPKKYRDAVATVRAHQSKIGNRKSEIFVAPQRVFKMGEEWTLNQVRSCAPDGYLIRNYDHFKFFANDRCIGDFSFNVANRLAADYFKNKFKLERVTASYDLNFQQLEALLHAAPPEWFEIT